MPFDKLFAISVKMAFLRNFLRVEPCVVVRILALNADCVLYVLLHLGNADSSPVVFIFNDILLDFHAVNKRT